MSNLIDVVDGYELPHNVYSYPAVRRAVKRAGLISVLVNDLVSTQQEKVAGVYQFGVREAIELEEGCSYQEAHVLGVRLHNDLYAAFQRQTSELMATASPELRLYLVGLEAWLAGSREWHQNSARYQQSSMTIP